MGLKKQLRDTEPFNQLPDSVFEEFNRTAKTKKFPPHTLVFKQHDPPTGHLYVIKEGLVEITVQAPGGAEMVVDHRRAGQFFGATPIFSDEPYTAGARTVKTTECYLIPQEVLKRAGANYPQLREFFTRIVLSRVKNLYADIVSEHSRQTLTQVDAFPFQKRLAEIMATPVETCDPYATVQQVAQQMKDCGVSSIVVIDDYDSPIGIITEKDIVSKVLAPEAVDCREMTAGDILSEHPYAMSPRSFMYEAMAYMLGHRIKHLPVIDDEEAVGMVTLSDLMRFRSQKALLLTENVKGARTIDDLVTAHKQIVNVAKALLGETRSAFETMEILSHIHHSILRRCFEIVLEEMRQEGMHPPDIRFCLFIMGSGGRKEMLLGPDQDNGFIFEDFPDEQLPEVEAFFGPFGERLVAAFARIGYPRCNGEVMVNNPYWRGRLKDWGVRVSNWIRVPEPKKVMYSTIFFDFMPLVGDPSLCQDLRDIVYRRIRETPIFLYHLMENDLQNKPALNLLGRLAGEKSGNHKGEVPLKQGGSVFIIDCVRIFALEKEITATTTAERIERLVELNVLNQETGEHLKAALEAITFLRLRHEISLIEQGQPPSPYLDPDSLSKNEQDLLKEAFRAAGKLQDSTKRHFSAPVG